MAPGKSAAPSRRCSKTTNCSPGSRRTRDRGLVPASRGLAWRGNDEDSLQGEFKKANVIYDDEAMSPGAVKSSFGLLGRFRRHLKHNHGYRTVDPLKRGFL